MNIRHEQDKLNLLQDICVDTHLSRNSGYDAPMWIIQCTGVQRRKIQRGLYNDD